MPTDIPGTLQHQLKRATNLRFSYAAQGLTHRRREPIGQAGPRNTRARGGKCCGESRKSYAAAVKAGATAPADRYQAFFAVLARDAQSSLAAIELVLAQPAISFSVIDNLNASMHFALCSRICF